MATAALAAMAIATGCGSDSDGETTETITKAAYVKQADAICLKFNEDTSAKFQALNQQGSPPSVAEQRAMTRKVYLGNLQRRLDGMKALPLPEEEEEEIVALLTATQKGIREALSQDAIAYTSTYEHFSKANKLAQGLGFKYCYEV
ncbi:MAG TPA: hypothetical protein VI039_06465 [Solirubrobacterales bacterium]